MEIRDYIHIFKGITLSTFLVFLTRAFFYIFNLELFTTLSSFEVMQAFLVGLRFDLATGLIVSSPWIIISLFTPDSLILYRVKKSLFLILNFFIVIINTADIEFFNFIGKKTTFDILNMGKDISAQAPQLIFSYWYLSLIGFLLIGLIYFLYPRRKEQMICVNYNSKLKSLIIGLLFIVLTFIGIRGGIQMRSLSPKNAYVFDRFEAGHIVLNSTYTLIRSISQKKNKLVRFYKTDKDARQLIGLKDSNKDFNRANKNIIIIILESFSYEYIEEGYAPFLKELENRSLSLKESYANGRRSIEALPSILLGLPSLLGKAISQSQFQTNRFYSLAYYLNNNGYESSFFHGGKKGTMDFDAFTRSIGIGEYHAKKNYPNQGHYDGNWGIYDHHFLKYFAGELSKKKQPFFSTIFTLSSHQPYSIPEKFKGRFKQGTLPIHESIGYVDSALADFFEINREKEWFKNTLFVITADHTQKLSNQKYKNYLGKYRVPLIFYDPAEDLGRLTEQSSTIGQHVDILPSVLSYLGIKAEQRLFFGSSVFDSTRKPSFVSFSGGRYHLYSPPNHLSLIDKQAKMNLIDWKAKKVAVPLEDSVLRAELERKLKAYIQYFHNGLIKNNIYQVAE